MRFFVPVMNNQIPNVRNPRKGVGKNKNRTMLIKKRIAEQQQRACKAQPPERGWHHYSLEFLCRIPLNEEPREENGIAQPADHFPRMPLDAEQFPMMPQQICEPIHSEGSLGDAKANEKGERTR